MNPNHLLIINANIITCDPLNPRASALSVCGSRIDDVGTNSSILAAACPRTVVLDLHGKTVTPGFIDAHLHPTAIYPDMHHKMHVVDLFDITSIDELISLLAKRAEFVPAGEWVIGRGYQDSKLERYPAAKDLDRISSKHPVRITHSSGHAAVFNSFALRKASVGKNTPDPDGGSFCRDADGDPNGICLESAMHNLFNASGIPLPEATEEEEKEGLELCFNNFLKKGITTVMDASGNPGRFGVYQSMLNEGRLPVRVVMSFRITEERGSSIINSLKILNLKKGFGNDMLTVGPLKLFAGNSLAGKTCWLYEPYEGSHKRDNPPYYGIPHPLVSSNKLNDVIMEGHKAGYQWAVHSNGDRDIDALLDAYEEALRRYPRTDHRHRIEHASIAGRDLRILNRMKELKVIPVFHEYTWEHGDKYDDYGEERIAMMHAYRSAIDIGLQPGAHSDWPVCAADPMIRIQSMVTRKSSGGIVYGEKQRVNAYEAIYAWTASNARALFLEHQRGAIKPGMLADLAVLSGDPVETEPEKIKDIQVEKTVLGGRIVHEK